MEEKTKAIHICHCDKCGMPIYPMAPVVVGKEGAKYHPECLENK